MSMIVAEPSFTLGVEEEYLLVDLETGDLVNDPPEAVIQQCTKLCDGLVELTAEDAEALDCVDEVKHAYRILNRGTSSHNQLKVYETCLAEGATREEALFKVVDWLIAETAEGL